MFQAHKLIQMWFAFVLLIALFGSGTSAQAQCRSTATGYGPTHGGLCGYFVGFGETAAQAAQGALATCRNEVNAIRSPQGEACRCRISSLPVCGQPVQCTNGWKATATGKGPTHGGLCGYFTGFGASEGEAAADALANCRIQSTRSPQGEHCLCTISNMPSCL